ncbi:hypothetical protein PHMEG_00015646 [Phytophthora megakarya]|uniref:Uncharacterized protein n=1 Tax=Phytophthora megakarya TaxID=4795 RepID=A0A225W169_9STRA|nr:hypothetical protein PHMEG_00015646 [Phytophthora megakarya]
MTQPDLPVLEEKPVEDEVGPTLKEKLQPELEPSTELVLVEPRAEMTSAQLDEQGVKAYTASQVSRALGTSLPSVEYSWPRGHPDSFARMNVGLATSRFLAARAVAEDPTQLCLHELAPDRRDLATAQNPIEVQVPTD